MAHSLPVAFMFVFFFLASFIFWCKNFKSCCMIVIEYDRGLNISNRSPCNLCESSRVENKKNALIERSEPGRFFTMNEVSHVLNNLYGREIIKFSPSFGRN